MIQQHCGQYSCRSDSSSSAASFSGMTWDEDISCHIPAPREQVSEFAGQAVPDANNPREQHEGPYEASATCCYADDTGPAELQPSRTRLDPCSDDRLEILTSSLQRDRKCWEDDRRAKATDGRYPAALIASPHFSATSSVLAKGSGSDRWLGCGRSRAVMRGEQHRSKLVCSSFDTARRGEARQEEELLSTARLRQNSPQQCFLAVQDEPSSLPDPPSLLRAALGATGALGTHGQGRDISQGKPLPGRRMIRGAGTVAATVDAGGSCPTPKHQSSGRHGVANSSGIVDDRGPCGRSRSRLRAAET